MLNFSTLSLLFCLVLFTISTPSTPPEIRNCSTLQDLVEFGACLPLISNLKGYVEQHNSKPPSEHVENMTLLCEKTTSCLSRVQCKQGIEATIVLDAACDIVKYRDSQLELCIIGFFKKVYLAREMMNETSCFKDYDFLEKDMTKRSEAYTNGQQCFLDYVKESCNESSIEFFSKNYEKFVTTMTTEPIVKNCKSSHHLLNSFQCVAVAEQTASSIEQLSKTKIHLNDPRVDIAIKLCRQTESCMNNSCVASESVRQQIQQSCNLVEMMESKFGVCISKIMNEKPDLSRFECLGGMDFYSTTTEATCEKYKTKKSCLKSVMSDICGEAAVEDYERIVDKVASQFKCE
ncbi:hypothetical protein GCK72_020293 [Caenorhabditis remanei]|uniref:T20D4.11-like domain-containing protein n=1 Tax=Caenorhabditis remanei TaxID=31234 RepID=A0A6A5GG96_CAERE|nr:hypothetical protein GCK72_020293 [Caenorhabditis remanei]KAF1753736.1 hypothetical protein GCK72_020293 [Caenorhabditis remanei]